MNIRIIQHKDHIDIEKPFNVDGSVVWAVTWCGLNVSNKKLNTFPKKRRNSTKKGFVYLITDDNNRVKIGVSQDAEKRFKNLKIANPDLRLFGKIPSRCYELEKYLHVSLKRYSAGGEWFLNAEEVILEVFNIILNYGQEFDAPYIITGKTLI